MISEVSNSSILHQFLSTNILFWRQREKLRIDFEGNLDNEVKESMMNIFATGSSGSKIDTEAGLKLKGYFENEEKLPDFIFGTSQVSSEE